MAIESVPHHATCPTMDFQSRIKADSADVVLVSDDIVLVSRRLVLILD